MKRSFENDFNVLYYKLRELWNILPVPTIFVEQTLDEMEKCRTNLGFSMNVNKTDSVIWIS